MCVFLCFFVFPNEDDGSCFSAKYASQIVVGPLVFPNVFVSRSDRCQRWHGHAFALKKPAKQKQTNKKHQKTLKLASNFDFMEKQFTTAKNPMKKQQMKLQKIYLKLQTAQRQST